MMVDSSGQKNYPQLSEMMDGEDLDRNSSLKKLFNLVRENTRVVDFGCATGYLAQLLKEKGCVVTGVEINEQAAKIAEKYCERVIVSDLDYTSLSNILPDQSFDVAVFGDVLEHLRDPWRTLKETRSLLTSTGYIVASIPNIAHGAIRLALLQGKFDYQELGILDNTHLRFFTRKTIEELFERSGYIAEIIDRTQLPLLSDSPLIPSLNSNNFDTSLIRQLESDIDIDTLQFIVRAFPASIENQYAFLKEKFLENSNQLEESQTELQRTRGQLEDSQTELQRTRGQLEDSQTELQRTRGQLEDSHAELQRTRGQLEDSHAELQRVQERLEVSQTELQQTQKRLDASQTELQRTHEQLGASQVRLDRTQSQLENAQVWIDAMESSKFWQLRAKWFDIKYALGLDRPDKHQKPGERKSTETFSIDSRSSAFQLFIDLAILVPNLGIYAEGWIFDPKDEIQSLTFVTEREKVDIKPILEKKNRLDLVPYLQNHGISYPPQDLGFFVLCPLSDTSNIPELQLQIQLQAGDLVDYKAEFLKFPSDPLLVIQNILTDNPLPNYRMRSILDNHIGPTVRNLWKNRERTKSEKIIREYGIEIESPEVSIVVPLYGRIDFLKYQLALFADDPNLKQNELIYVLDDPRLYEEFLALCDSQYSIFETPFKTVYTSINQGYAGANNTGASIAKGRLLLLLNSDVMPIRSGWLSSLVNIYDSLAEANVGAISPKLLYGNGSIQHAGMKFVKYGIWDNLWINDHPRKGQPNFVDPNSCPQQLLAVTGACMMVSRSLYTQVGGIDDEYIIGDFEDSDFCLKLHALGFKNYYIPSVELFHLERQSLSLNQKGGELWKTNRSLYNCWLFNQKWEQYISQIMYKDR